MFNFYEAVERVQKEKEAEAKRLEAIENETDTAAWRLYQALNDYVTQKGLNATIYQSARQIKIKRFDDTIMIVNVMSGPTFEYIRPDRTVAHSVVSQAMNTDRTKSIKALENAIVDWMEIA